MRWEGENEREKGKTYSQRRTCREGEKGIHDKEDKLVEEFAKRERMSGSLHAVMLP